MRVTRQPMTIDADQQAPQGTDQQPLATLAWLPRTALVANSYNPNHVAPPELRLLTRSLLEDGWTQPIVARADGEIVDGYHRWLVAADPQVAALTNGLVPVVRLRAIDPAHQVLSTIRHNRARGSHAVLRMAAIVRHLLDQAGLDAAALEQRLEMEDEEVDRLYDRGGMPKRGGRDAFSRGWIPE